METGSLMTVRDTYVICKHDSVSLHLNGESLDSTARRSKKRVEAYGGNRQICWQDRYRLGRRRTFRGQDPCGEVGWYLQLVVIPLGSEESCRDRKVSGGAGETRRSPSMGEILWSYA